jgi:SpoVK/Ycf46/Vps4 family AAA+-type ATPase
MVFSIMSKYYGESEKRFADIFEACKQLGLNNFYLFSYYIFSAIFNLFNNKISSIYFYVFIIGKAILFIDEIDSIASSRGEG